MLGVLLLAVVTGAFASAPPSSTVTIHGTASCPNGTTTVLVGWSIGVYNPSTSNSQYKTYGGPFCLDSQPPVHVGELFTSWQTTLAFGPMMMSGSVESTDAGFPAYDAQPRCVVCLVPNRQVDHHWGSDVCPGTSETLYTGIAMGGTLYGISGNSGYYAPPVNPICMHSDLEHKAFSDSGMPGTGYVSRMRTIEVAGRTDWELPGSQYRRGFEVACAVCATPNTGGLFTHWGRSRCPDSDMLMSGGTAASFVANVDNVGYTSGGFIGPLCMDPSPTIVRGNDHNYDDNNHPGLTKFGYKSDTLFRPFTDLNPDAIACSSCQSRKGLRTFMYLGDHVCPDGFDVDYTGLPMATRYHYKGSWTFAYNNPICVDYQPEGTSTGGTSLQVGAGPLGGPDTGPTSLVNDYAIECAQCTANSVGPLYVRWGIDTCPVTARRVHVGRAATGPTSTAIAGPHCVGPKTTAGFLHGYNTGGASFKSFRAVYRGTKPSASWSSSMIVTCALCEALDRDGEPPVAAVETFVGTAQCPDGWFKEYEGIMMGHSLDGPTDFSSVGTFCMDIDSEDPGTGETGDSATYVAQMINYGGLSVDAMTDYDSYRVISCVVCVAPTPPYCGDGVVTAAIGEVCDDGNDIDTDSCVGCQDAECGDGYIQEGVEACDDGNTSNGDDCTDQCQLFDCGDGVVSTAYEECEDSDSTSCSDDCLVVIEPASLTYTQTASGFDVSWTVDGSLTAGVTLQGYVLQYQNIRTDEIASIQVPLGSNTDYALNSLPVGAFRIRVMVQTSSGFDSEAKFSSWVTLPQACGCTSGNPSGAPTDFAATQKDGRVTFSWTDASLCDSAYAIYADDKIVFSSIASADTTGCGAEYTPEITHALASIGTTVTYSIYAVDPATEYTSSATTDDVVVQWTHLFHGYIKAPGQTSPTDPGLEGANVTISLSADSSVFVKTTTDPTGFWQARLTAPSVTTEDALVRITPDFKPPGGDPHIFACGLSASNACDFLELQAFHNADSNDAFMLDISILLLQGTVKYDVDADCATSGVEVCMTKVGQFGNTEECLEVDPVDGSFTHQAFYGDTATLEVNFLDHTFSAAQWTYQMTRQYLELEILDVTRRNLTATVAGGDCGLHIGPAEVIVRGRSCQYEETFVVGGDRDLQGHEKLDLPAMELDLTFDKLCDPAIPSECGGDNTLDFEPGVDYYSAIVSYLVGRGERNQIADLRETNQTITWQYYSPPEVSFDGFIYWPDCDGGNGVYTARMLLRYEVEWWATESYGDGPSLQCSDVGGSIHVEDQTGLLTDPCHQVNGGCDVPMIGGYAALNVTAGIPNTVGDFLKLFAFQYNGRQQLSEVLIDVLVRGYKNLGTKFSMNIPDYVPTIILRDPPGGASTASLTQSRTESSSFSISKGGTDGSGGGGSVYAGFEGSIETCVGLGAAVCTEVASFEGGVAIGGGSSNEDSWSDLEETSIETTLTETFSTSDGVDGAGAPSDRFFVPALTILVSKIDIITFNGSTCHVNKTQDISWGLDSGQAFGSFTWRSASDIEAIEIPALQDVLDAENAKASPDPAAVKVLEDGIGGWQNALDLNQQLKDNAVPFTGGVGEVSAPGATVGSAGPDTVISFSGGGGGYTLEMTSSKTESVTHEFSNSVTDEFFTEFGFAVSVGAVTVGADGNFAMSWTAESGGSNAEGVTNESTYSFTLDDPDTGDILDVRIRDDRTYGLVFELVSGQTRCPHEPGSIARDGITLSVNGVSERTNILPGASVTFDLNLNSASATGETFDYTLQPDAASSNGLVIQQFIGNAQGIDYTLAPGDLEVTVSISRADGVDEVDFSDVTFALYPTCGSGETSTTAVSLAYIQPCSEVVWAGDIAIANEAVVSSDNPDVLAVDVGNPKFSLYPWSTDARLESVQVQMRPQGAAENAWTVAKYKKDDIEGIVPDKDLKGDENAFGKARFYWLTEPSEGVLDGMWELRARALCSPSGVDTALDISFSPILTVEVDRRGPQMFGFPEPSDGVFEIGDDIEVEFDEDLDCNPLATWTAELRAPVVEANGDISNELVPSLAVCEGRKIVIQLSVGTVPYENFAGKNITATVSGVKDAVGNELALDASWDFAVKPVDASGTVVNMNGLVLDMDYVSIQNSRKALIAELRSTIASATGTDADRIEVPGVYPADGEGSAARRILSRRQSSSGGVQFDVRIKPAATSSSDTRSPMELASAFATAAEDTESALYAGSLANMAYDPLDPPSLEVSAADGRDPIEPAVGSGTTVGSEASRKPEVSVNGRFAVFESFRTEFVNLTITGLSAGGFRQCILYDAQNKDYLLASGQDGSTDVASNGHCESPSVSDTGVVLFHSVATDLVPGIGFALAAETHVYRFDPAPGEAAETGTTLSLVDYFEVTMAESAGTIGVSNPQTGAKAVGDPKLRDFQGHPFEVGRRPQTDYLLYGSPSGETRLFIHTGSVRGIGQGDYFIDTVHIMQPCGVYTISAEGKGSGAKCFDGKVATGDLGISFFGVDGMSVVVSPHASNVHFLNVKIIGSQDATELTKGCTGLLCDEKHSEDGGQISAAFEQVLHGDASHLML